MENRILSLLSQGAAVFPESRDEKIFRTVFFEAMKNLYMKHVIEFENGCIIKGDLFDEYIEEKFGEACLELLEQSSDNDMSKNVFETWIKSLMLEKD